MGSLPNENWWTLVGSVVVLLWMAFVMPQCAGAQGGSEGRGSLGEGALIRGTWTTFVEETRTTVWLVIRPPSLVVVMMRDGTCLSSKSNTRWDDGESTNPALGWTVRVRGDTLEADLPATQITKARTMTYHRTTEQPSDICSNDRTD